MDEKKVREAIERMCKMRDMYNSTLCSLPPKTREKSEYNNYVDTFLAAIEALEKQLPKEIKAIDPERSEEFGDVEFCCPNCNSHYLCDIADVPNYCPECGIRFDT
ncbi:hypothetical protein [Faecalimonas umbilicata]|uniref:hypothetical protein n=1 Tax=Faecalimonas umbilicata TaxID=1912855 RepID=UPI003991DBA8